MDDVIIKLIEDVDMKDVTLIEGLPGVGNVGKLALDHMIKILKPVHFANIYSKHLPPQVLLDDDGIASLVAQKLYHYRKDDEDFVFLAGEYQGATGEGQYELAHALLRFLIDNYGLKRIYTLGGYGLGKMLEEPRVLGAATCKEIADVFKEHEVVFSKGEPSNGIVGASGILLGLGKEIFGIDGGCLMGETSGYIVDAKSARKVLAVLSEITGIEVDMKDLEIKSEETEELLNSLKEVAEQELNSENEDLRYIG
jgi:uncharacterized protein (TIGR00162 family)